MNALTADPQPVPVWRRVLPFLVGGGLVAFVLSRLDFEAFTRALRRTHYFEFVGFAAVFSAALLAADAYATMYAYARTVGKVRYKDLFVVRAASYLPSVVNHHVGQAWLTYFLSKATRVPLLRTAGATLFSYATTFGALFLFLLVGLPFNHGRVAWLLPTVSVVGAAAVGYGLVLLTKPRFLAEHPLLAPLFDVGLGGHVLAILVRFPHVLVQFLGAWIPFLFFGVRVPFTDALALVPVIMFVVTLPVSPQGIGTRDTLSIALLSGYAAGTVAERNAVVAATTLSWIVVITLIQLSISPLFMRRAYQLLGRDEPPATS